MSSQTPFKQKMQNQVGGHHYTTATMPNMHMGMCFFQLVLATTCSLDFVAKPTSHPENMYPLDPFGAPHDVLAFVLWEHGSALCSADQWQANHISIHFEQRCRAYWVPLQEGYPQKSSSGRDLKEEKCGTKCVSKSSVRLFSL